MFAFRMALGHFLPTKEIQCSNAFRRMLLFYLRSVHLVKFGGEELQDLLNG